MVLDLESKCIIFHYVSKVQISKGKSNNNNNISRFNQIPLENRLELSTHRYGRKLFKSHELKNILKMSSCIKSIPNAEDIRMPNRKGKTKGKFM